VFRGPFAELLQARDQIQDVFVRGAALQGPTKRGRRGPVLGPVAALFFGEGSNRLLWWCGREDSNLHSVKNWDLNP
jgi:hypothetical protein